MKLYFVKCIVLTIIASQLISCGKPDNLKGIKGLMPADVYLNMEKTGFETNKNLTSNAGCTWENTKTIDGVEYRVVTFSSDINSVESVSANAMALPPKNASDAKQFLKFISSLPYNGSNAQEAGEWVDENFNSDKAEKVIGSAKFTIYAPSEFARMIRIEKSY